MREKKRIVEFRFYEKPGKDPVLALMGKNWIKSYGDEADEIHFHNLVEIGYCYQGKGNIIINNEMIPYRDHYFTFIPQNCLHTTKSDGANQWEYLFFDLNEILDRFLKDNYSKQKLILSDIDNKALVVSEEDFPYVGSLIRSVFDLEREKGVFYRETIRGCMYTILMHILRMQSSVTISDAKTGNRIMPALEYVQRNYTEDIKVSELAGYCCLSETHFRRLFAHDMNMGPVEYINLIRIQAACDLILKGDYYMEEVAAKVGYQTMSTFNRNFRQILGISPYQWKKQMDSVGNNQRKYRVTAKKGWDFGQEK